MLKYLPQIFISHKIKYSVSRLSMILVQPTLLARFSSNFPVDPASHPHGTSYYLQECYSSISTLCCLYLHCKVCSLQQSPAFPISLTHISPLKLSWNVTSSVAPLMSSTSHQTSLSYASFHLAHGSQSIAAIGFISSMHEHISSLTAEPHTHLHVPKDSREHCVWQERRIP